MNDDAGGHAWTRLNEEIDETLGLIRHLDDDDELRERVDKSWGEWSWRCSVCGVTAFSKKDEMPRTRVEGEPGVVADEIDDGYVITWSPKPCNEIVIHGIQES